MFKTLFSKKTPVAPDMQTQTPPVVALPPNAFQIAVQYHQQGDLIQASAWYQQILQANPNHADAYNNLGLLLQDQKQIEAAIACFRSALAITPDDAEIYSNLGVLFWEQGHLDEAVKAYQQALSLNPNEVGVLLNLGTVLKDLGQFDKAIESYRRAFAIAPERADALDDLLYAQIQCCDWDQYAAKVEKVINTVAKTRQNYHPFLFLAICDSVEKQLACAKSFATKYPVSQTQFWTGQRYQHDKVRIAYVSADFREHPVSHLIAGLIEQHDREKFEVIAISLRSEEQSSVGQRIKKAFDQFIDASVLSDYDVAMLMQRLEIDIAIDLMGYTTRHRTMIFSHRAAPIQVNYLGFPGTMGVEYMDYIIADKQIIPEEQQISYSEKVVYLPDCYLPNDYQGVGATEDIPTRSQANLPEHGFVFCSFNNTYKITPDIFALWMRLLSKVEHSVLWLTSGNFLAVKNLREQAMSQGISPERLVFAPKVPNMADHLARQRLADLFLDTLPYNAHTTASDALSAGLPVLTCVGNAFAGNVASSLLKAVGLPELITNNVQEYENLALKLATTPDLLAEIRTKLAVNRTTHPLFNTDRFRRHIEAAYITMWERYQDGKSPASFAVPPIDSTY